MERLTDHGLLRTVFAVGTGIFLCRVRVLDGKSVFPDNGTKVEVRTKNGAKAGLKRQYDGTEAYVFISQVLTKEKHEEFTEEELFPVTEIIYTDAARCGTYGPVTLHMADSRMLAVLRMDME